MAWRLGLAAAIAAVVGGCHKPYKMTEVDYVYYNRMSSAYEHGEADPRVDQAMAKAPRTIVDPTTAERWDLPLEEAKRLALLNNPNIAVIGHRPGEAGAGIDEQLAAFDAYLEFGGQWSKIDRSTPNAFGGFGAAVFQQNTFNGGGTNVTGGGGTNGGQAPLGAFDADLFALSKRNATGGSTRVSYGLNYVNNLTAPPGALFINPSWQSVASITMVQPFLQGAGVEFNRAPLLIARASHLQSIRDYEATVRDLLRDVELAYWDLHFTYQDLYSRETAMRQTLATWQKERNKQELGASAEPDVAQARERYEFFRAARLQALNRVLDAERRLRQLMGAANDDNRQIVPADEPTIARYQPNWEIAVMESMELRPELGGQRLAVRSAEIELVRQQNGLMADLTGIANYTITGLDNQYDQSVDRLTDNRFTDWTLGFRYRRQIGERAANAAVRRAQLAVSRERAQLRNLEYTVVHELQQAYQELSANFELIKAQEARRLAATQQLIAQEQFFRRGRTTIDVLLQAQTFFADALRDESQAIVLYNQALTRWEYAKGTILSNDNVYLAENVMSKVSDKLIRQRQLQFEQSIPLPLKKSSKHSARPEEIDPDFELSPYQDGFMPVEELPAPIEAPAPTEAPVPVAPPPAIREQASLEAIEDVKE